MPVVVSSEHEYGAVVSVHAFSHVVAPFARYWMVVETTPEPAPSSAVAASVATPRSAPGSGVVTAGAWLSMRRTNGVVTRELPALSSAPACSSTSPSGSVVVSSEHERGEVAPEHSVIQLVAPTAR